MALHHSRRRDSDDTRVPALTGQHQRRSIGELRGERRPRTLDALRLTYPHEVDGYRRYARAARPVVELVLELATQPPSAGRVLSRAAARPARPR